MATQPSDSAKQRPRSSPGDELAVIAQRAQAFTNASSAAIALSEGSEDEIVCRARSGSSAPDIGASLRVQGSFTGLCIQTGKELRCDDAETDTRVDTLAIRSLGIRSMVVTPIREDNRVTGVLAVFAPTPHAFTITHVAVLKTMADQIAVLLQKERRAREENAMHPEPPLSMPRPMAVVPSPPPAPAPVVIKPASSSSSAATAAAPARSSSSAPAPRMEPIKPVPLAAEVSMPVPFPKKDERRAEHRHEPLGARASFGTFDAVAGEQKDKSAGNKMVLIGVVAVVLVGAGVFGFMRWQKPSSNSSASGTTASTQNAQTAQNAAPAGAVPPAAASTQPPATSTTDSVPAATTSAPAGPAKPPVVAEKPDTRKPDQFKNSNAGQTTKPAPTPATVAISASPSRIATNAAQSQTSPDVAPSLTVGSGSSSNTLSSLAKPANNSAPAALVQSELVPLQVIRKVPPIYPEFARARRMSGPVVVRVKVGVDGRVNNVQFVSGAQIFRDAAFEAAKQSQYKPALLNGKPIEQEMDIRMNFTPN